MHLDRTLLHRRESGFTLIETVLAVGIAAILATSATPVFIDASRQAQLAAEESVTGHVQTGITLEQMETLALAGLAQYPPTLDNAPTGVLANPNNPFFTQVLQFPVTAGWRKEAVNTYRSPTGNLFVYNPENGSFTGEGETSPANPNNLGNIVYEYAGIAFYDTGAIVDTTSSLAYVPSLSGENVTLTLGSGTQIDTHDDGSALISLDDGQRLKVADIHKPAFFQLSPEGQTPNEQSYHYVWVNQGQASEGKHATVWQKKEYNANSDGGSFHYEYDLKGEYSGGSLKKDFGFIYRTAYSSPIPQVSKGSWVKKENGDTEGTIEHSYDYESDARSGYDHPDAKYRYAFQQTGSSKGWSETGYRYDAEEEVYESSLKGHHKHRMDRDASNGPFVSDVEYDFDGTTAYDKKNEVYQSKFNYQYKDGRDLTYDYEYDGKDKTYAWSVTDNKTGKTTRQTNRKEEKEIEKEEKKEDKEKN